MKVINTHRRIIHQSKDKVAVVFRTLSSKNDRLWPSENWPAIRFKDGLKVGSKGGHGIIRYTILEYRPEDFIKFQFTKQKGFHGTQAFHLKELSVNQTEVKHVIEMTTSGFATMYWLVAIRWMHDALIEDAFDKVVSQFSEVEKTRHSVWVRFLRYVLTPKKKTNH